MWCFQRTSVMISRPLSWVLKECLKGLKRPLLYTESWDSFFYILLEIYQHLISSAISLLAESTVKVFHSCLQSVLTLSTFNRFVSSRRATALIIFLSSSFMYLLDRADLLEHVIFLFGKTDLCFSLSIFYRKLSDNWLFIYLKTFSVFSPEHSFLAGRLL